MKPENYYDNLGENYLNTFTPKGMEIISRNEKKIVLDNLDKLIMKHGRISVLELGVGAGRIAMDTVKRDIKYTGIDISKKMVDTTRELLKKDNIHLFKHDITNGLPFADCNFNLIYSIRVLKYLNNIPNIERAMLDIKRVLSNDGLFIFSIPNKLSINALNRSFSVPYLRLTIREVTALLTKCGFTNIKIIGGPKLPDIAYIHSNNLTLPIIIKIENTLNFTNFGSRMLYICAEKSPM